MNSMKLLIAIAVVSVAAFLVPGAQPVQAIYYTTSCADTAFKGTCDAPSGCYATSVYIRTDPYTCCETRLVGCTAYQGTKSTYACSISCPRSGGAYNYSRMTLGEPGGNCPNCGPN